MNEQDVIRNIGGSVIHEARCVNENAVTANA